MYDTQAIEGITLASFAFQEHSHILSVFSKERGRIKCVAKRSRKSHQRSLCPMLYVEMQVVVSAKELWKCRECVVVNSYPSLRLSLEHLRYAAQMTDLLNSFLPLQHPVAHLYSIYSQFLVHLPNFIKPHVAASCFLQKLLVSEGMLESGSELETKSFSELIEHDVDLSYYNALRQKLLE